MRILTFALIALLTKSGSALASPRCKQILSDSSADIHYNQEVRTQILNQPETLIGRKIVGQSNNIGFPFRILELKDLPSHLSRAVRDIQILSEQDRFRDQVFGSSKRQVELSTSILEKPLSIPSDPSLVEGFFVEVGVDVYTLEDGTHFYVYFTGNAPNYILSPHEFRADIIAQIERSGRKVIQLDSFHTHPLTLFPSMDDKLFFQQELAAIYKMHPKISFNGWTMNTVMEGAQTFHRVELIDWVEW